MIITCKKEIPEKEIKRITEEFAGEGLQADVIEGTNHNIIVVVGDTAKINERYVRANPWIEEVTRVEVPYKKANRLFHPEDSVIDVSGVKVGGNEKIVIIGGPCSVEGEKEICDLAKTLKEMGADMLRGGAYKPRTSPYSFQGLGTEGIRALAEARKLTGLPIVSEIMSVDKIDEFVENVDLIQVGARNMQNFDLLKELGKIRKPVLLKRGLANTIEEWLMSAEYILAGGNDQVILCERGIRTFEQYTRNTLDLSVIPVIKKKSHLPIIIDPSHATGDWQLVESMSLAAIAAGADGLIIEVHDNPEFAWSDGAQSLKPERFQAMIEKGRKIAEVIGRGM